MITCYELISNICKDNFHNQNECYSYFHIFKEHIGLDVGAEQCMITILKDNEKLLQKIHQDDLNEKYESNNLQQ